ncbi:hypothetical protein CVT24_010751 [Panaeolus cyanescens]|uniref:F-box domain-containing protein n=1 Tax=Panaeolus cyanescens TaxID=181874 RepID=A0A409YM99_9AGAR|nr:hypothetical protein CVT24_010751 [Panaeolus cyanescens]
MAQEWTILNFDVITSIIWTLQNDMEAGVPSPSDHIHSQSFKRFKACRHALFCLALTCKPISDAALRALWHRLDDLRPILTLVAKMKLTRSTKPVVQNWTIEGDLPPPTHCDWDRFHYYAAMVQDIRVLSDYVPGSNKRIHHSVYSRIIDTCCRREDPSSGWVLFPNLLTLDVIMGPAMLLFQTSTRNLRRMRIRNKNQQPHQGAINVDPQASRFIQNMLRESESSTSHLRALALDGVTITPAALLKVFGISSLQTLHLSFTLADLVSQLVRVLEHEQLILPNLNKLSIYCLDNRESPQSLKDPRRRLMLPSLQTLLLQGPLDSIAYMCKAIGSQNLASFTLVSLLHRMDFETSSIYRDICESMNRLSRRFPDAPLLRDVTFNFGRTLSYLEPAGLSSFFPLFSLENLTSLTFHQYAPFTPSDANLEDMGKAWPNLQTLKITSPPQEPIKASLQGVKCLIEHCPGLLHLSLTFDASNATKIPRVALLTSETSKTRSADNHGEFSPLSLRKGCVSARFPSNLCTFDVGVSVAYQDTADAVADFLWWMFPELKSLTYAGQTFSTNSDSTQILIQSVFVLCRCPDNELQVGPTNFSKLCTSNVSVPDMPKGSVLPALTMFLKDFLLRKGPL